MSASFSSPNILSLTLREGAVHEIARGDFNGDGIDDLVVARFLFPLENRGVPLQILAGDGVGGFTDVTTTVFQGPVPTTVHPREIVVADFNGDGRADFFLADHGYDADPFPGAQNRLILSTGTNHLFDASARLPQQSDFTHSAAVGDVDNDGDIDIYVGNVFGQNRLNPTLLINDGTGAFTASPGRLPASTQAIAQGGGTFTSALLSDLNRDGWVDLVLGTSFGEREPTQVLLNNRGTFAGATPLVIPFPPLDPSPGYFNSFKMTPEGYDIQTVNLNGDALPDLVIVWINAGFTRGYVQLLVNQNGNAFVDETAVRMPQDPAGTPGWIKYVHLTDVNADGFTDIVSERVGPGALPTVHLNDGTGRFASGSTLPNMEGWPLEPVDANRDGRWDLAAMSGGTSAIFGVLTNLSAGTPAVEAATELADTMRGGSGNDLLRGLAGDDNMAGREGNDTLVGGRGNDVLDGGTANDVLEGGFGNDVLIGDAGTDVAVFSGARSNYFITRASGTGHLTVSDGQAGRDGADVVQVGIETLRFQDGDLAFTSFAGAPPTVITIASAPRSISEGNGTSTPVTFVVSRIGDTGSAGSVNWTISGSGMAAASATDFVGGSLPSGTLDFLADQVSKSITVNIVGDRNIELVEEFSITLSAPSAAAGLGIAQAAVLILNDEAKPEADFNGDGRSDIILRGLSGELVVWQMNNSQILGGGLVPANPGLYWKVDGTGDFDGDARSDILLRGLGGEIVIWQMNGSQIMGGGLVAVNPGSYWNVSGTDDFNGDGRSDILLRGLGGEIVIWQMNGNQISGGGLVPANPGTYWSVAGTDDFDGDSRADILLRGLGGEIIVWQMNGNQIVGGGVVPASPGTYWKVDGTSDFNGDGRSDMLLRGLGGEIVIWQMNGIQITGGGLVPINPGQYWKVDGTDDLDGDRNADIILRGLGNEIVVWQMAGNAVTGAGLVPVNPGAYWDVVL